MKTSKKKWDVLFLLELWVWEPLCVWNRLHPPPPFFLWHTTRFWQRVLAWFACELCSLLPCVCCLSVWFFLLLLLFVFVCVCVCGYVWWENCLLISYDKIKNKMRFFWKHPPNTCWRVNHDPWVPSQHHGFWRAKKHSVKPSMNARMTYASIILFVAIPYITTVLVAVTAFSPSQQQQRQTKYNRESTMRKRHSKCCCACRVVILKQSANLVDFKTF